MFDGSWWFLYHYKEYEVKTIILIVDYNNIDFIYDILLMNKVEIR